MLTKLRSITIILIILITHISLYAETTKKASLKREVDKICLLLQHPFEHVRSSAVNKLVSVGSAVSPYLAQKYLRCNYLGRRKIVEVWQNLGDERSINYIFSAINDSDEGVRMTAAMALLELSDRKKNIVAKLKNIVPRNRLEQNTVREIISTLSYKEVEVELARLITPNGGYSYCSSQYHEIKNMGKRAVRPLLSIFSEDNYRFIHYEFAQSPILGNKMRILAGQALAEMKDFITDIERVIVLDRLKKTCFNKDPEIRREVACILKKFGDTSFWKKIIDHDKKYIWENPGDTSVPYHLGMMFFRVDRNYQAIEYFERTILLNPHDSLAYYRLACTHARRKSKAKALKYVQKAFENGFHDYLWVKNDPDIKNLNGYKNFDTLLKQMEQKYINDSLGHTMAREN